jgi:hypothetical protein
MHALALLSTLFAFHAQSSGGASSPASVLQVPMNIGQSARLALSPKLDGNIDENEWDPLGSSNGSKATMRWESGKLIFNATVPSDNDLIVSLDLHGDGWLVGNDNLEIRLSSKDGSPKLTVRELDGTQVSGPQWVDVPNIASASTVTSKTEGNLTTYDFTIADGGSGLFPKDTSGKVNVKLDPVASSAAPGAPFVPRTLAPVRLAEDDPASIDLTPGIKSYFQWEPSVLHFAAVVPVGQDLLISLDMDNDGWSIGSDNVEVRVSARDGKTSLSARLMDATQASGPRWVDLPGIVLSSLAISKSDANSTVYELSLQDGGLGIFPAKPGVKIGIRIDSVVTTTPPFEPYLPRLMSPVDLVYTRSTALPGNLTWAPEGEGTSVVPGENIKLRLTFKGSDKIGLKRLAMKSECFAYNQTSELSVPFPGFDAKGRAYVDYRTDVAKDASLGYRVLRATLMGPDETPGIIQVSYRIAPLVDVQFVPMELKSIPQVQTVNVVFYVRAQSNHGLEGEVGLVVPDKFKVLSGNHASYRSSGPHGSARMAFKLAIPAAAQGPIPIDMTFKADGKTVEITKYLNIE